MIKEITEKKNGWNYDDMLEQYGEEFLQEKMPDDVVMPMEELDDILDHESPTDILLKAFNGYMYNHEKEPFNPNAEYFFFNGYDNLVSLYEFDLNEYYKDIIDEDEFKEYCIGNSYFDEE